MSLVEFAAVLVEKVYSASFVRVVVVFLIAFVEAVYSGSLVWMELEPTSPALAFALGTSVFVGAVFRVVLVLVIGVLVVVREAWVGESVVLLFVLIEGPILGGLRLLVAFPESGFR